MFYRILFILILFIYIFSSYFKEVINNTDHDYMKNIQEETQNRGAAARPGQGRAPGAPQPQPPQGGAEPEPGQGAAEPGGVEGGLDTEETEPSKD